MENQHHPLTLFIIKKFYDYNGHDQVSNGVRTSVLFVVDLLLREGHRAKLEEAIDGNCVDRIITQNRPSRVVLEALWVTPEKIAELRRLHPSVRWTVRIHSEIPFLANEGMAIDWIVKYLRLGVQVAFNSKQTMEDFPASWNTTYLPNYYPLRWPRSRKPESEYLDVGCFGAVRPLKNQLIQAFAAIRFAHEKEKMLRFHMNSARIEQNGANNLKNIKALFAATGEHLVLHSWMVHEDFLELIAKMDICLQVSLSESFNITSADAVSIGVPLVGSQAISWLPRRSRADVDSVQSIAAAMGRADDTAVAMNHESLEDYLERAVLIWNHWLRG